MTADDSSEADSSGSASSTEEADFEIPEQTPAEFLALTEALTRREWTDEAFEVNSVDVRVLAGMWFLIPAVWDPEETPDSFSAHPAVDWSQRYLTDLGSTWGEPRIHDIRLSPDTGEPEGPIDLVLGSLGFDQALVWTREDRTIAVISGWNGEPGASRFSTLVLIMPEETSAGGVASMLSDDETVEPGLMHGEELTELHRRAFILATRAGRGEETVLGLEDIEVRATRCECRFDADHWMLWVFTSDGRALLLVHRLDTYGLLDPNDDDRYDEAIEQLVRLYQGVPDDLIGFATAPASTADGVVDNPAGFIVDGRELPEISGAFWFDGEDWHSSAGLIAFSNRYGVGINDVGFEDCVRRPMRLGGEFEAEHLFGPAWNDLSDEVVERARDRAARIVESSPYPRGTRPEGRVRLGTSIPDAGPEEILDDVESTIDDWWDEKLRTFERSRCPFTVGGRRLESNEDRLLMAPLAHGEEWYADAFDEWLDEIVTAANDRWGDSFELRAHEAETGRTIRTPLTRPLRGQGFESAPVWWVNGMVFSIMHGTPADRAAAAFGGLLPDGPPGPTAVVCIARADAVLDPMRGATLAELRFHLRIMAALAGVGRRSLVWNSTPIGHRANNSEQTPHLFDHTTAEAVRWVLPAPLSGPGLPPLVPEAAARNGPRSTDDEGRLRMAAVPDGARGYHAWHFTHDSRALLVTWCEDSPFDVLTNGGAVGSSHPDGSTRPGTPLGGPRTETDPAAFARQQALFAGVPPDLLSLVSDRMEETGMHTVMGPEGRSLAVASGVFWFDGRDWCVSDGLLAAVHEYVDGPDRSRRPGRAEPSGGAGDAPPGLAADVLMGGYDGLGTAAYAVAADVDLDSSFFARNPEFCRRVLGRVPYADEVGREFGSYGRVETVVMNGSLNDFLDVRIKSTDYDVLVPAALSNPDPRARRELCLWLLGSGASATAQFSHSTNLTILLDNDDLDPDSDAVVVSELISLRAARMLNTVAPRVRGGGHPVVQLCDRDLDDALLEPLYAAILDSALIDVDRPVLPGGLSVADYVAQGVFPHSRDRSMLRAHIDRCRDERQRRMRETDAAD